MPKLYSWLVSVGVEAWEHDTGLSGRTAVYKYVLVKEEVHTFGLWRL